MNRYIKKLKAVWRKTPLGRVKKNADALKWGILGTGYMARTFAETIDESHDDVVYAVASRSINKASSFASQYKAYKCYGNYEDLVVNPDIDIVYIATPVECHYEHIRLCLEAGRNVLCEKPLTTSAADAEFLIGLARENGCFLMEGMWMKCLPTFKLADEWISSGKIGEVKCVWANLFKRTDKPKSIMRDYGEYAIAFICHFLKKCTVEYFVKVANGDGIDTDWCIAFSEMEKRGFVDLSCRFGSLSKACVIGTDGSIEWSSQFNRAFEITLYDIKGNVMEKVRFNYRNEGFEYELNDVHKCLKRSEKECLVVSLESTLKAIEIIDHLLL